MNRTNEIEKLKKKIGEIDSLKNKSDWGPEFRLWLDLTTKLVKEIFGSKGLKLFEQNSSVLLDHEAYIRELSSRKVTLEGLLNNEGEYQSDKNNLTKTDEKPRLILLIRLIHWIKDNLLPIKVLMFIFGAMIIILILVVILGWQLTGISIPWIGNFSPESQQYTKVNYFAPSFDNWVMVSSTLSKASCWDSLASDRSDSLRCSGNQYIFDPCFKSPNYDSIAICPTDPYGHHNHYFYIDSNISSGDKIYDSTSTFPWYIKLSDNSECKFNTGATALVADMRMDYDCNGGGYASLLLPIKEENGGTLLKIHCYDGGNQIKDCDIKEVWY